MTEEIITFPVKPRDKNDLFLVPPPFTKCKHYQGPFEIDRDAGKCVCKTCGEEVSPMLVLERRMNQESRWMQSRANHKLEMERLEKRLRTKCVHCGKTTTISRS